MDRQERREIYHKLANQITKMNKFVIELKHIQHSEQCAANTLLEIDYKTFVLSADAMEKHGDRIKEVLASLENELQMDVLLPGKYKLKANFIANGRLFAKTRDAIKDLITKCGLKKYPQTAKGG